MNPMQANTGNTRNPPNQFDSTSTGLEQSYEAKPQAPESGPQVAPAAPRENSLSSPSSCESAPSVKSEPGLQGREPGHLSQNNASNEEILRLAATLHSLQEETRRLTLLQQLHTEHAQKYQYDQRSPLRYLIDEPEDLDLAIKHLNMDVLEGVWIHRVDTAETDPALVYQDLDRICHAASRSKFLKRLLLTSLFGPADPRPAVYTGKALYQLISQSKLKTLHLQGFKLPPEGWIACKEALAKNASLSCLTLKPYQLDTAGLRQLVDGVLAHRGLESLHIRLPGTLDDGMLKEIRRLLVDSEGLKSLSVYGFASNWDVLSAIFEAMSQNSSIEEIELATPGDCPLPQTVEGMLDLLGQHPSLRRLDLSDLKLDLEGARLWCDFMETSRICLPSHITIEIDDEATPGVEAEKQGLLARIARYAQFDEEAEQLRSRYGSPKLALALALKAGFENAGKLQADSDLLDYMETTILDYMPRVAGGKDSLSKLGGFQAQ